MKATIIKLTFLLIVTLIILVAVYKLLVPAQIEPVKAVIFDTHISNSQVVSRESKLIEIKELGQLVSMEKTISKEYISIDEGFFGERHTSMTIQATYKMGLNTGELKFRQINNDTIAVTLPEGVLVSLEIPYDQIEVSKDKGKLRRKMNEDDLKSFYSKIEKSLRTEIVEDEETLEQLDMYNQKVVEELVKEIAGYRYVVFEN